MAPKVLIGAAGTATAFGILRTLRDNWGEGVEVFVAEMKPRHLVAAVTLADGYLESPSVGDPGYAAWLERALTETEADLYVPLIDLDIEIASRLAAERDSVSARVAAPPPEGARVCADKLATYEWLAAAGIPTPGTWEPQRAAWSEGGLVAKSRYGSGSVGFRPLRGPEELTALNGAEPLVVQAACGRPEVTIDAYLAGDGGRFRAICRERLETKAGVCVQARVFESAELSAMAERIARGLGMSGGFCAQVMRGPDDEWWVTDVNARVGGGTRLSTVAGVDVLGAVFADLLGLPLDLDRALAPLAGDVYVVRQHDEFVID